MRAIVRNPGLGLYVRKLSVNVWDKPSYTIAKTIDDCPKFEFAEFDKIIRTLDPISYLSGTQEGKVYVKKAGYAGVDPRPGLEELFYRQNYMEDAYVALLLSKVPNLQELTYGSGRCKASSRQIWTLVEEAVRNPRVGAFPKLQDVSISYPNEDASLGVNLWEILDLLWGPSLRNFHATKCYWLGPSTLKSYASTIHTIDLENCEFPAKAVAHLLAHCKGLKTFNISYDLYRTGSAKATGVVHALRLTQSMSLETLKIVYSDDPDRKPVYSFSPSDLPTPCSLHGPPSLKHLIFGQLPL